jgi:MFS transporter, DHA3 family, multidrug efflux protein
MATRSTLTRMPVFRRLLLNSLLSGASSAFLWFAVTFWVFIETKSVVATSMIGGVFALTSALLGVGFGTYVDHHRKRHVMVLSTVLSLGAFAAATVQYALFRDRLLQLSSPHFWIFVVAILIGAVAGNLRGIALATCVTLLVPEDQRDRANGMVGTVNGLSFTLTSVFSGLVIGRLGMGWALLISVIVTAFTLLHLLAIHVDEPEPVVEAEGQEKRKLVDVSGALVAIRQTRGLMALILFAAFNNLLGGIFMSLMDAYGLSLMSVESWGLMFAFLSFGFIVGGLIVARNGVGKYPLRLIIVGNFVNWAICMFFTARSSIILLGIGMLAWMTLMPVIEAAEQTVLQRAVPFESQGRVFGFAQTIENLASPLTSFMIGPLAEVFFIPFMTKGRGVDLIGSWFGTGPERGLALIFSLAGVVGIIGTLVARTSKSYRHLSVSTSSS